MRDERSAFSLFSSLRTAWLSCDEVLCDEGTSSQERVYSARRSRVRTENSDERGETKSRQVRMRSSRTSFSSFLLGPPVRISLSLFRLSLSRSLPMYTGVSRDSVVEASRRKGMLPKTRTRRTETNSSTSLPPAPPVTTRAPSPTGARQVFMWILQSAF